MSTKVEQAWENVWDSFKAYEIETAERLAKALDCYVLAASDVTVLPNGNVLIEEASIQRITEHFRKTVNSKFDKVKVVK